ncbi:uncharacterized protein LOC132719093 [Ruditapes philippinarum]|uniref:uncharacterized protein LOC132719093 n=1 Tax=Ruditapes philippinarum TaxID=129788 RepID=UPI00295C038B|nr:uncharacterized protein LOC132719093 [Ruditapes philippinarum]
MKRSDVMKILFVCVCVCHICPAHNACGENPLRLVDDFSRDRGFDPETMLAYMRERAPNDYSQLMSDYRVYLGCTQSMHTGYFKRSVDAQDDPYNSLPLEQINDVDKQFMNKFGETVMKLFGSRQQSPRLSRNHFNSMSTMSKINVESLEDPLSNRDDLPFIIKRLLRSKITASHQKRDRRLHTKEFMNL